MCTPNRRAHVSRSDSAPVPVRPAFVALDERCVATRAGPAASTTVGDSQWMLVGWGLVGGRGQGVGVQKSAKPPCGDLCCSSPGPSWPADVRLLPRLRAQVRWMAKGAVPRHAQHNSRYQPWVWGRQKRLGASRVRLRYGRRGPRARAAPSSNASSTLSAPVLLVGAGACECGGLWRGGASYGTKVGKNNENAPVARSSPRSRPRFHAFPRPVLCYKCVWLCGQCRLEDCAPTMAIRATGGA